MKLNPNHVAPYFGSGKHEIIQASGLRVHKDRLNIYLNKKFKVRVYKFPMLLIKQLAQMKSYAYSRIGRPYDWAGIASFLFPCIQSLSGADYCTELSRDSLIVARLLLSDCSPITPAQFERLLVARGFVVCYEWDKGEKAPFCQLSDIPPGSMAFVEGYGTFAKLIKWFQKSSVSLKQKVAKIGRSLRDLNPQKGGDLSFS